MPNVTGSFSGKVTSQVAIAVTDQPNHDLCLVQVRGLQSSSDENWNNTTITYCATLDVTDGQGPQRGYFVNARDDNDRAWGAFEAKVMSRGAELSGEGAWHYTGGSGKFKGITGKGTFKTRMTSPKDVECSWEGTYELAAQRAHAR